MGLFLMLTDGLEFCGVLWCFYEQFGLNFFKTVLQIPPRNCLKMENQCFKVILFPKSCPVAIIHSIMTWGTAFAVELRIFVYAYFCSCTGGNRCAFNDNMYCIAVGVCLSACWSCDCVCWQDERWQLKVGCTLKFTASLKRGWRDK